VHIYSVQKKQFNFIVVKNHWYTNAYVVANWVKNIFAKNVTVWLHHGLTQPHERRPGMVVGEGGYLNVRVRQ
jgi:hypothetical protein